MIGPPLGRDQARQPERTALAWRRTLLAVTVVVVLAIRPAVSRPDAPRLIAAALALAGWAALLAVAARRVAALRGDRPGWAGGVAAVTALTVVGYAALGAFLIAVG